MADTWEIIPQIHRTILFEEFTHAESIEAVGLFDILNMDYDSDEEMYEKIKEKLEVHSFGEFLEKFQPTVYEYTTGSEGGLPQMHYTIDPKEASRCKAVEIELTKHSYYEMLVSMYNQKSAGGVANIEFNDAEIREILTPKREMEKIRNTRRQVPLLMERYDEKVKKNENPSSIAKQMINIRKEAVSYVTRPTTIMSIYLDDINRKVEAIDQKLLPAMTSGDSGDAKPLLLGRGGFDENGQWVLIPAKSSASDSDEDTDSATDPRGDNQKKFAAIIKTDLDKRASSESNFTRQLVVSAYTGVELDNPMENMDTTALQEYRRDLNEKKNTLEKLFKDAKDSFIKALSDSVQKILSVKIFFEHATNSSNQNAKLPGKAGLIVANCTAGKLLTEDNIKTKFENIMQHLGNEVTDENKIWFGIIPHVTDEDKTADSNENSSWDMDWDDDTEESETKKKSDVNDFSSVKSLLKIMEKSKILTVFNFAPDAMTTFSAINADTIRSLEEKLTPLDYEHAVYAVPNFTIMRSGCVPISDDVNTQKIDVPAMYIDASYVAAGLLIAAQQPQFWLKKNFKDGKTFTKRFPCVRIDFESPEVTYSLLTHFNRERSIAWSKDVKDAFIDKRFGFAFDGDRVRDTNTGNFIDNTYILNARTLKLRDGKYQQIFRTLTKDFIQTYLKTFNVTKSTLNDFHRRIVVDDWEREIGKTPESVNLLLHEGEDITIEKNDSLKVKFLDGEDVIEVTVTE